MTSMIPFRGNRHMTNRPATGLFDDDFFRSFFDTSDFWEASSFRVDVKDKGASYELEAELPGVPQENIEISANDGYLTISANTDYSKNEEKENYVYKERRTGRCQRSFSLDGIDEERIDAKYVNGVLTVTLPKLTEQEVKKQRKIEIH